MNTIDSLLHGSIDMHAHYGPDPSVERKLDALRGAQMACEAGMRAIVLKSHEYPTAPLAYIVGKVVPNILVFGGICLDTAAGGLNSDIVETSAKLGARVVWMPTFSSNYDYLRNALRTGGISILDGDGELLPAVEKILDIIKQYKMVLATGHLPVNEAFIVVEKAKDKGISRIVATHPLGWAGGTYFSVEQQCRMAAKGAFIEHCFSTTTPEGKRDPKVLVETLRAVGAEHCFLSTDLGQMRNPAPAEGMRMMIEFMLKHGVTEREIELMIKTNPARLLGLE